MTARQTAPEHAYRPLIANGVSPTYTRTTDVGVLPAHRRSLITGTGADHRPKCPSSTQDISAPLNLPNIRKRRRTRRRNNPLPQTSVAHIGTRNSEKNVDNDRPAKRARRVAASLDGRPAVRNRSSASTGFSGRQTPANAATGSRATPSSDRLGRNDCQVDANANQRMDSPYFSITGGMGGAGGAGGIINGSGGNAMGPVFNVNNMTFYFQR